MLNKFNLPSLNNYCQTFAQNVCQDFYSKHNIATGKDLLNLTLIQQVNLFVIKGVYEKWKSDTEAFRSPYFNFEAANVQQSLQTFMNVVSQNINVGREHLEPLVTTAVYDSLILLLDPQAYFNEIYRSLPDFRVTPQITKQLQKYTRWNAFLAHATAEQIADKEAIYVNEAISSVEENLVLQAPKIEPIDKWVAAFSTIAPLNLAEVLKKMPTPIIVEEPKEVASESSFFDTLEVVETPEPVATAAEISTPVIVEESMALQQEQIIQDFSEPLQESLNDRLRTEHETLADNIKKQTTGSITQNIALHQKFMFIQQLYHGSSANYDESIKKLEQASSYQETMDLIKYTFAKQYSWDMTDGAAIELIELVKRKFGI